MKTLKKIKKTLSPAMSRMRTILLFSIVSIIVSCTNDALTDTRIDDETKAVGISAQPEIKTRSLEGAVYNEVMDVWMVPQKDPYTLKNFQKAYDKLAASSSELTTAAKERLKATHLALRIYPRNEDEQWRIEMMEDVAIKYIPFDYIQLTGQEVEKIVRVKSSVTAELAEKSPYTVSYNAESIEGHLDEMTYQLPILYAVWPIEKPLPSEMDYKVDYEIFLPRAAKVQNTDLVKATEQIVASEILGLSVKGLPQTMSQVKAMSSGPNLKLSGYLQVYDNVLRTNVPIVHLRVSNYVGSNYQWTVTDETGAFTIETNIPSSEANNIGWHTERIYITYQDHGRNWQNSPPSAKWKITTESSVTPITTSLNATFPVGRNIILNGPLRLTLPTDNRQLNEIHRAVNYFYYANTSFIPANVFSPSSSLPEIRIKAYSTNKENANGSFYPAGTSPYIEIFNNNNTNLEVIGTTLHELGHFVHYWDDRSRFGRTHNLLIESFASYVGWYSGLQYYLSHGWINNNNTSQQRQGWRRENNSVYTPLFVDLTDDFNQGIDDNIRNVPPSLVWSIIKSSTNWTECEQAIQSKVGTTYCTTTQRDAYLANYVFWFSRN